LNPNLLTQKSEHSRFLEVVGAFASLSTEAVGQSLKALGEGVTKAQKATHALLTDTFDALKQVPKQVNQGIRAVLSKDPLSAISGFFNAIITLSGKVANHTSEVLSSVVDQFGKAGKAALILAGFAKNGGIFPADQLLSLFAEDLKRLFGEKEEALKDVQKTEEEEVQDILNRASEIVGAEARGDFLYRTLQIKSPEVISAVISQIGNVQEAANVLEKLIDDDLISSDETDGKITSVLELMSPEVRDPIINELSFRYADKIDSLNASSEQDGWRAFSNLPDALKESVTTRLREKYLLRAALDPSNQGKDTKSLLEAAGDVWQATHPGGIIGIPNAGDPQRDDRLGQKLFNLTGDEYEDGIAKIENSLETFANRAMLQRKYEDKSVSFNNENYNKFHATLELLAEESYEEGIYPGEEIIVGDSRRGVGGRFLVKETIDNPQTDLQAFLVEEVRDDGASGKTIIIFRGTKSPQDWLSDAHAKGVGYDQFFGDYPKLQRWMQENQDVVITGHSLGGALAQQTAINLSNGDEISEVITFNSPGLNSTQMSKDNYKDFQAYQSRVTHYVNENDVVSFAGERFMPGNVVLMRHASPSLPDKHSLTYNIHPQGLDLPQFTQTGRVGQPNVQFTEITIDELNNPHYGYQHFSVSSQVAPDFADAAFRPFIEFLGRDRESAERFRSSASDLKQFYENIFSE
jgi:hypothetical protein